MPLPTRSPNSRVPWWIRLPLVVALGLLLAKTVLNLVVQTGWAITVKLRHNAPACSWARTLTFYSDVQRFSKLYAAAKPTLAVKEYDPKLDIELIASPKRTYWIKRTGTTRDGLDLLAYLIAEHEWVIETSRKNLVRAGDIVLDCGAHVGTFASMALELGAAKVVAIEPDPVHLECLRRNFAEQIASGRVVVVPKGVWNSEKTLTLFLGVENSGMNSVVERQGGAEIQIPVTTIDNLTRALGLPRVDYIKMDIEGAEREALRGAEDTIRQFRPRLIIEGYHLPDDTTALPAVISRIRPDYSTACGPCEPNFENRNMLVPHFLFYE